MKRTALRGGSFHGASTPGNETVSPYGVQANAAIKTNTKTGLRLLRIVIFFHRSFLMVYCQVRLVVIRQG